MIKVVNPKRQTLIEKSSIVVPPGPCTCNPSPPSNNATRARSWATCLSCSSSCNRCCSTFSWAIRYPPQWGPVEDDYSALHGQTYEVLQSISILFVRDYVLSPHDLLLRLMDTLIHRAILLHRLLVKGLLIHWSLPVGHTSGIDEDEEALWWWWCHHNIPSQSQSATTEIRIEINCLLTLNMWIDRRFHKNSHPSFKYKDGSSRKLIWLSSFRNRDHQGPQIDQLHRMDPLRCPYWRAKTGYKLFWSCATRSLEQLSGLPMRGK